MWVRATRGTGSYLVFYQHLLDAEFPNDIGFEYEHIGFRLVFSPFEADSRGSSFILQHYKYTDMIVRPAPE